MVTRDTTWPEGTPCWVDLSVSDIPKAIAFYTAQFGWRIPPGGPEVGGYSVASLDDRTVAGLGPKMGPTDSPAAWMTYLATDNADATVAKIQNAGGKLLAEPMNVMEQGRMAIAMDITGAPFGVWQGRAHTGTQVANVPGALVWNEHFSADFEGAKAFYAAVFGYQYGDMSSEGFSYATLLLAGHEVGGIGGYPAGTPDGTPAAWATYFGAADTDAAVMQATKSGGAVIREPGDSPYGRTATVADDQGAVFSLISIPPGD